MNADVARGRTIPWCCGAAFLLIATVSCERSSQLSKRAEHIVKQNSLKNFITDIQMQETDSPSRDIAALLDRVRSYSESTNYSASKLRSDAEVLWINGNLNCWAFPAEKSAGETNWIAGAGYRVRGTFYTVWMNPNGEMVLSGDIPVDAFSKIEIKRVNTDF